MNTKKTIILITLSLLIILLATTAQAQTEYGACQGQGSWATTTNVQCATTWRAGECAGVSGFAGLDTICADSPTTILGDSSGKACAEDIASTPKVFYNEFGNPYQTEFCQCGDKIHRIDEGGECATGQPPSNGNGQQQTTCTSPNIAECGDWEARIVRYFRSNIAPVADSDFTDGARPVGTNQNDPYTYPLVSAGSSGASCSSLREGDYYYSFYALVNETKIVTFAPRTNFGSLSSSQGAIDDKLTLIIERVSLRDGSSQHVKKIEWGFHSTNSESVRLDPGWYNFTWIHEENGCGRSFAAVDWRTGTTPALNTNINQILSVVNSHSPVRFDPQESEFFCKLETDYYIRSRQVWRDDADPERRCCTQQNHGYVHDGYVCNPSNNEWVPAGGMNTACLLDDGVGVYNPMISQETSVYDPDARDGSDACCGNDDFILSPEGGFCRMDVEECNSLSSSQCADTEACRWVTPVGCYPTNFCRGVTDESTCVAEVGCAWEDRPGGDIGWIGPSEFDLSSYACFDNYRNGELGRPGNNFWWREAYIDPFTIMQAGNTQFISNSLEWFYCDASGTQTFGNQNIPEYGSPPEVDDFLTYECLEVARKIPLSLGGSDLPTPPSSGQVYNCEDSNIDTCMNEARDDARVFCARDSDGEMTTFNPGEFINDCSARCRVRDESTNNEWESLRQYFDIFSPSQQEICKRIGKAEDYCKQLDLEDRWENVEDCPNPIFADGCGDNVEDRLGENCRPEQDDDGSWWLVCDGEWEEFNNDVCGRYGGDFRADPSQYYCSGMNVTPSCCLGGGWVHTDEFRHRSSSESFICYSNNEQNLLKECCAAGDTSDRCNNLDNPLNFDASGGLYSDTYSLQGGALHTLFDFYQVSDGIVRIDQRAISRFAEPTSFTYGSHYALNEWSAFQELIFHVSYPVEGLLQNITLMSSSGSASLPISDFIGTPAGLNRFHQVVIPFQYISNANPSFDFASVSRISISYDTSVDYRVGSDRVRFRSFTLSNPVSNEASQNYYCSGPWREWLSSLDGPDDSEGFFGQNPSYTEYAPYEFACNRAGSSAWTGTVCCGDDTRFDNDGEWFVDRAGACWQGRPVLHDQTVASTISSDYKSRPLNETSLLFYDGKLYACNPDNMDDYDIPFSFNGETTTSANFRNMIDRKDVFSIVGSWMCEEDEGWVRIRDVNKVRILSSVLNNIGTEKNDYTLFCGNARDVSNTFGMVPSDERGWTNSLCVLRTGSNDLPSAPGLVIAGLEITNISRPFEDYDEQVLQRFLPFHEEGVEIDCSGVPSSPSSTEFFKSCSVSNNNQLEVYYNKPFNLVLVADGRITGTNIDNQGFIGFFIDNWAKLRKFFSNLFGGRQDQELGQILELRPGVRDLYVAKQGDKIIAGQLTGRSGLSHSGMITYKNINTDASFLAGLVENRNGNSVTNYISDRYIQTLFLSDITKADWMAISSNLRLTAHGDGMDFGFTCNPPFVNDNGECHPPQCFSGGDCGEPGSECLRPSRGDDSYGFREYYFSCLDNACRRIFEPIALCDNYCVQEDNQARCVECITDTDCIDSYGNENMVCKDGGCVYETDEDDDNGEIKPVAIIERTPSRDYVYIDEEVVFKNKGTVPGFEHFWYLDDDEVSRSSQYSRIFRDAGRYSVTLHVRYGDNEDSASTTVDVKECERLTCDYYGVDDCVEGSDLYVDGPEGPMPITSLCDAYHAFPPSCIPPDLPSEEYTIYCQPSRSGNGGGGNGDLEDIVMT